MFSGCGTMIAKGMAQDFNHGGVYHFVAKYKFNYINKDRDETPTLIKPPPTDLKFDLEKLHILITEDDLGNVPVITEDGNEIQVNP